VTFVAAAVCPHPPLLVPELAAGAAVELDALRRACDSAVHGVLAVGPDRLIVVGGADEDAAFPRGGAASFAPYGLPVQAGTGPPLPLSLGVGGWLLDRAGWSREWSARAVAWTTDPKVCAAAGRDLVDGEARVALLVLGDGSARHHEKAPGYVDPRAGAFDGTVAEALRNADAAALADLDPDLATDLLAAGRASWQVLAGAAAEVPVDARLLYHDVPYGVGYFVASWIVR
jgi:hypothetical protein